MILWLLPIILGLSYLAIEIGDLYHAKHDEKEFQEITGKPYNLTPKPRSFSKLNPSALREYSHDIKKAISKYRAYGYICEPEQAS